jgi:hypothetical protein
MGLCSRLRGSGVWWFDLLCGRWRLETDEKRGEQQANAGFEKVHAHEVSRIMHKIPAFASTTHKVGDSRAAHPFADNKG